MINHQKRLYANEIIETHHGDGRRSAPYGGCTFPLGSVLVNCTIQSHSDCPTRVADCILINCKFLGVKGALHLRQCRVTGSMSAYKKMVTIDECIIDELYTNTIGAYDSVIKDLYVSRPGYKLTPKNKNLARANIDSGTVGTATFSDMSYIRVGPDSKIGDLTISSRMDHPPQIMISPCTVDNLVKESMIKCP